MLNLNYISFDDLLELVNHISDYDIPTQSKIYSKNREFLDGFTRMIGTPVLYHKECSYHVGLLSIADFISTTNISEVNFLIEHSSILHELDITSYRELPKLRQYLNDILKMPCMSEDDVRMILQYASRLWASTFENQVSTDAQYEEAISALVLLLGSIIPFKFASYSEYLKHSDGIIPEDDTEFKFSVNYFHFISKVIINLIKDSCKSNVSIDSIAALIIIMYSSVGLKAGEFATPYFELSSLLWGDNSDMLRNKVTYFESSKIDLINAFDMIYVPNDAFIDFFNYNKSRVLRAVDRLYNDDKVVSSVDTTNTAFFGDNILGNTSLSDMMFKIRKMNKGLISKYMKTDQPIIFTTTEDNIGFMKSELKLSICKVYSDIGVRIIFTFPDDETVYLLFRKEYTDELWGISVDTVEGNKRKIVKIKRRDDNLYKMTMN